MTLTYETKVDYTGDDPVIQYRRHGQFHRTDGPAELWHDGDFSWCQYGDSHRDDGPAEYVTAENSPCNGQIIEYYHRGTEYVPEI